MRLTCGVLVLAVVLGGACRRDVSGSRSPDPAAVRLRFAYSSEKQAWLDAVLPRFAAGQPKTPSGKPIVVEARPFGSGEAGAAILDGSFPADVYAPASTAYLTLLNDQWRAAHGNRPLVTASEPLVLSPIVIAMWKPMAEALGWPGKQLGWADLLEVAQDPRGWTSFHHPEWGAFKLGHTHPEHSNSGLLAVLAEAFAGAGKTRGLTREDLQSPKLDRYLTAIESAIVHYGKSTALFTDQMRQLGPSYMSAAVTYENLVIASYQQPGAAPFPLVAIYPVEGTFWSDHPYAVLSTAGADQQAAGRQLLAFLEARPQQEAARDLGFRPADPRLAITAPLDAAHGVDATQPQTLLELPPADVLRALLAAWQHQKKAADVMIVFDRSGSMAGKPLAEAKAGARAFIQGLGDGDALSIQFFSSRVEPPPPPVALATARPRLLAEVDGVFADGGTALYDATAAAYDAMLARSKLRPDRIHAVVVMTDGKDSSSRLRLDELAGKLHPEDARVKIFTIAYGDDADPEVLGAIARAGQGTSVVGTSATIVGIYRDLAALF